MKHIGSFSLLFFLSVAHPRALWSSASFSFAPIFVVVLLMLFFYKVHHSIGFKSFFLKYKLELALLLLYQVLSVLSVIVNLDAYHSTYQILAYAITPLVIQMCLPLSIFLFSLPQNHEGVSITRYKYAGLIPAGLLLFVPLMAVWQFLDDENALTLYQYFVAGNLLEIRDIRSLFAVSTDLGAISAILVTAFIYKSLVELRKNAFSTAAIYAFLAMSFVVSGVLSGARIFILMMAAVLICFLVKNTLRYRKGSYGYFLVVLVSVLCLITFIPQATATKLAGFLPAILSLNLGVGFIAVDFLPTFSAEALGIRYFIWGQVFEELIQSPMWGTSNGGFRLYWESIGKPPTNAHNFFLQTLVDAGIPGFLVMSGIFYLAFRRCKSGYLQLLFFTCCAGLLVDNFIDHSLPWIIVSAGTLSLIIPHHAGLFASNERNTPSDFTEYNRWSLVFSVLGVTLIVSTYSFRLNKFQNSNPTVQMELSYPLYATRNDMEQPRVIVGDELTAAATTEYANFTTYFSSVAQKNYCHYLYPYGVMLFNKQALGGTSPYRTLSKNVSLFSHRGEQDTACALVLSNPLAFENWISNHSIYLSNVGLDRTENRLRLKNKRIVFWSPIFLLEQQKSLTFNIAENSTVEDKPQLLVNIYDADNNELVLTSKIVGPFRNNIVSIDLEKLRKNQRFFIRLAIDNLSLEPSVRAKQYVDVKDFYLN